MHSALLRVYDQTIKKINNYIVLTGTHSNKMGNDRGG